MTPRPPGGHGGPAPDRSRVLITGASGLVGTWLLRTAPARTHITAASRTRLVDRPDAVRGDLRDPVRTRDLLRAAAPDVVIHAAYAQDRDSIVDATTNMLGAAREVAARCVLLSTDAVFDGDGRTRGEDDVPDPVWDYGRWKVEAERAATAAGATIVRLPLLVSLSPPDAATRRIREASAAGRTVGWFAGERRQPAHAVEVARTLWSIVELPEADTAGVWHLAGAERVTRRELGARIAAALGVADPGEQIPPPPPTQRPHDLHLTDRRARERLGWRPSPVTPRHLRQLDTG